MRILLIGPLPPPLGGVSVQLSRLKRQMEAEGHDVRVLDPTKHSRAGYYLRLLLIPFGRYETVAVHVQSFYVLMILFVTGMAGRTEVNDANWCQLEGWGRLKAGLYGAFLRRCKRLVLAEALYLGCPAVASDVCERAPGAVLFASRDAADFVTKCRLVLDAPARAGQDCSSAAD